MRSLRLQLRLWDYRHPVLPVYVWAPVLLLAVVHWLRGLPASYAIDETGSFYLACAGPAEALRRSLHHVLQSPLYHLILSFFLWPLESPAREMVSRLPSLAGLAGATWMLYRMGERWIGRGAGVTAALLFASIPGVASVGTQARHYGLLWCCATVYLWCFWSWMTEGRARAFFYSRLALAGCLWLHPLAGLLCAVDFLTVALQRRLAVSYWLATGATILAGLAPVLAGLSSSLTLAGQLRYLGLFRQNHWTFNGAIPLRLTLGLALGWLIGRALWPRHSRSGAAGRAWLVFLTIWGLGIPAALGVIHIRSDAWTVRYFLLASPALCLLTAAAFARLAPSVRAVALVVPLLAVLLTGRLLQPGGSEDFRQAAEVVRELSLYETSPLLVPSWFVEAAVPDARPIYEKYPAVYGHLTAYPVPNPIYPLPVWYADEQVEKALGQWLDGPLGERKRVLVGLTAWTPAFQRAFGARGWSARLHGIQGTLVVAECVRDGGENPMLR